MRTYKGLAVLFFAVALLSVGTTNAQTPNAYGYSTGYGTVYGSFGLASTMQSMYNVARAQSQRRTSRDEMVKKWGPAAVEKAEREAAANSRVQSNPQIVISPQPIVRNYGLFRPDATVDTGKALADALGETPEEKALIKQIYTATRAAYDKEAAARGWKNNIAAGLTFFTVAAMTVYHNAEPSEEAVNAYYKVMNAALDEIPEIGKAANKDKQGFNNTLVGFGGLLLAGHAEGKQSNDPAALEPYKKLAGMLIQLVLKTDPEKVSIDNGQIVLN
jgi:hypothetical protein